jgi:hypothetical protein
LGYTGGILPLDLLDFKAVRRDKTIEIVWTTTNEINLDVFEVHRASADLDWKIISTIDAKSIDENGISEVNTYYYSDITPLSGENYYRLKINDKDGFYDFSKMIMLGNDNLDLKLFIFPNPVIDRLFISDIDFKKLKSIQIFDNYGNKHLDCKSAFDNIDVSKLSSGVYLLRIQLFDGTMLNKKALKG